jgi:hypothetical protein
VLPSPPPAAAGEPTLLPFIISSDKAFKQPRNENVNQQESINHHRLLLLSPPTFSSSFLFIFPLLSFQLLQVFFFIYFFDKLTRPYIVKVLATRPWRR